jgi:hypothetical protein
MRGRAIALSRARRLVVDVLHFAHKIPTVPVQKRMSLAAVAEARTACPHRPRWTAIFMRAYGLLAREVPEFRRVYVKLPWPHLFEYRSSVGGVVIEREYQGDTGIFCLTILNPAARTIDDLHESLENAYTLPVEQLPEVRRALRVAALPGPLRRLMWWLGLNISRYRAQFFSTFCISVYSALKAESLHPLMPVTTLLNYGIIDPDGSVTVRIIYDHRVMNGATVARALNRLEEILNTTILDELRGIAGTAQPASPAPAATSAR